MNWNAIHRFPLIETDAIPGIKLSARVIGKTRQNLYLMALFLKSFCKRQALEKRFRLEPLGEEKNPHAFTIFARLPG